MRTPASSRRGFDGAAHVTPLQEAADSRDRHGIDDEPQQHREGHAASLLLQPGESPAYVQRQLGHVSIQLTVDTYGKVAAFRLETRGGTSRSTI